MPSADYRRRYPQIQEAASAARRAAAPFIQAIRLIKLNKRFYEMGRVTHAMYFQRANELYPQIRHLRAIRAQMASALRLLDELVQLDREHIASLPTASARERARVAFLVTDTAELHRTMGIYNTLAQEVPPRPRSEVAGPERPAPARGTVRTRRRTRGMLSTPISSRASQRAPRTKGDAIMGMGLWDPRLPYETWPEPVIFRPDARRLYRGDPQQLRNAVRVATQKTPMQVCNQRMLSGLGVDGLGYVPDGSRTPPQVRSRSVSRLELDRRWGRIRDYITRMKRYRRQHAEAQRRLALAVTAYPSSADRWVRAVERSSAAWTQARNWVLRDLVSLSNLLRLQYRGMRRVGVGGRELTEARREWQDAATLHATMSAGNSTLGSCCDAGVSSCCGDSLGVAYGRDLYRGDPVPPPQEVQASAPIVTVRPADIARWSCVLAEGLMKVRLRSGRRIPWSSLTNANQDEIMADRELAQGFVVSAQRCQAASRDPAVQAWAARQRKKTGAAHTLAERQHPKASFAREVGEQAGILVGGAGKAVVGGTLSVAKAFVKKAWPVLLGGGLLYYIIGRGGRAVAHTGARRAASAVGAGSRRLAGRGAKFIQDTRSRRETAA